MSVSCLLKAGGRWRSFPVPVELSLFQTLRNFCYRKKSTAPEKTISSVSFYDENAKESGNALDKLFSSEQQASILHVLNTASDKELEAFKLLHGKKSISIIEHREKFGPFQDLESLMNVPSFQFKTIVQVCNSILYPEGEKKKRKFQENRLLGKLIKPDIERERLKAANSILSIVFGTQRIAWALLDRKLTVLDWQQIDYWKLVNRTYPSSLYLKEDGQHHVLSMNRNAVGKHFKLMIGDTRTSGKELVKQFLSESVLKAKPRVFFPPDRVVHYRQMFSSADPPDSHRREELYDSLLQAIAFYELAVFDTES
ncbi:transcription elongation factor, mitochondrial isoform X3 [Marmota marmota marmota]|uniref:transcription elongation factor, mitochondrial isoform X3 n=1 Tax=Marmota marmota marmota TaxID=9994 RepID=UPI0020922642|nr:transcription elongation factor, mitochondrial isoform X3 [Marmota marmota marmota]